MAKRRSWASWFPIAKRKPMGVNSDQEVARRFGNGIVSMRNPALMTNEDRAYRGLGPIRLIGHIFTPGGNNG